MNLKYYGSLHVPSGLCLLEKMLHLSFLWRSIHWGTTPCPCNHRWVGLGLAPWGGPSGHWEVARNAVWNSSAAAPTGYWLISTINTKVSLRLAHLIISDALEPNFMVTELFGWWAEPSQVKILNRFQKLAKFKQLWRIGESIFSLFNFWPLLADNCSN